jgi:hypothetical protein
MARTESRCLMHLHPDIDARGLRASSSAFRRASARSAPVAVERVDEVAIASIGQSFRFQEAPRASFKTSSAFSSWNAAKKSRHSASNRGVFLVAGVEVFDIGCVGAVKQRRQCEYVVRFLPCHVRGGRPYSLAGQKTGPRPVPTKAARPAPRKMGIYHVTAPAP